MDKSIMVYRSYVEAHLARGGKEQILLRGIVDVNRLFPWPCKEQFMQYGQTPQLHELCAL